MSNISKQQNLVERVLQTTNTTQASLANELGVSPAQVSKWKSGETIPEDRKTALKSLMQEEDIPRPLRNLFNSIKENYLDDKSDLFEDHFEGITELLVSQLEEVGVQIPAIYLNTPLATEHELIIDENFEDLIHGLLSNHQALEEWYEVFILNLEAQGGLFDLGEDIRAWFSYLAWKEIDQELLVELGVDIPKLNLRLQSVNNHIKLDLYKYCDELTLTNTSFRTDYHILLKDQPSREAQCAVARTNILCNRAKTSAELLPYPYQILFDEIKGLKEEITDLKNRLLPHN